MPDSLPDNPARIARVTAANAAEDKRLEPIPVQEIRIPPWLAVAVMGVGGALTAALPLVPPGPWTVAIVVAQGALFSIAAGLGMLSSGKTQP